MTKNIMQELKKQHGAWLVIKTAITEDWNCVITESYLVFKENEVLEVEGNKVEPARGLFIHYNKLKNIVGKLEDERKAKLEVVIKNIEPDYRMWVESTSPKSFKAVNKENNNGN